MNTKDLVVLIVEDSLMIIKRILSMVEEVKNVKLVIHAANYKESIKMLKEIEADIVLLDINLPDKSGVELLKEIKSHRPLIKVIMFTNHASEDYRNLCLGMGADYFLDKSNDFDKIPEAIAACN